MGDHHRRWGWVSRACLGGLWLGLLHPQPAEALDIFWNGGISSDWHDVNNWNSVLNPPFTIHRVPGDGDIAFLVSPFNDTVTLSDDTAPINGLHVFNGIDLDTNGHRLEVHRVSTNSAAVTTIDDPGSRILVRPRLDDPSLDAFETGILAVRNQGQIDFLGGHGAAVVSTEVNNNGTLSIGMGSRFQTGTLRIANTIATPRGEVVVSGNGSELRNLASSSGNIIHAFGTARLTVEDGATAEFFRQVLLGTDGDNASAILRVDDAQMTLFSSSLTIGGGPPTATGQVILNGSDAQITQTGSAAVMAGGSAGTGGAAIVVQDGATFTTGIGGLTLNSTAFIDLRTTGSGGGHFVSRGPVNINGGELTRSADSTFTMADNALLRVHNNGSMELDGGFEVNNGQSVEAFDGGQVILNPVTGADNELEIGSGSTGTMSVTDLNTHLSAGGGTRVGGQGGSGELSIGLNATADLGTTVVGNSPFQDQENLATLRVHDGANVSVSDLSIPAAGNGTQATVTVEGSNARLVQAENASLFVGTANVLGGQGPAVLNVQSFGRFTHSGGTGSVHIFPNGTIHVSVATFDSEGDVTVDGGALHAGGTVNLRESAQLSNHGGTVSGGGRIKLFDPASDFTNAGVVAPGNPESVLTTGGLDVDGDYIQTPDGSLAIEINGEATIHYDRLTITDTAQLAGAIDIQLTNDFIPTRGTTFEFLSADEITGNFMDSEEMIQAIDFTVDGGVVGDFRIGDMTLALVPILTQDPTDPDTITLLTTVPGDANADGVVDVADLGILGANFNQTQGNWYTADFNADGATDVADLGILGANWSPSIGGGLSFEAALQRAGLGAAVPEPGTMTLLVIAGGLCLGRRRS